MESSIMYRSAKIDAMASTLSNLTKNFREVMTEYQDLQIQLESYRSQYLDIKDSKSCQSCVNMKETLKSKNYTIEMIGSIITQLQETKNLNLIQEALKILFGESKLTLEKIDPKYSDTFTPMPEKSPECLKEESLSEIESTPTGRLSPIIHSKKTRIKQENVGAKKKSDSNWPSPLPKVVCLPPRRAPLPPRGRLRQSRLQVHSPKTVVDLTSSPELRVKCEPGDNDDTIMPSPSSSGAMDTNFTNIHKLTINRNSPRKVIEAKLSIRRESDSTEFSSFKDLDETVNMFNNKSLKQKVSPTQLKQKETKDPDETMMQLDLKEGRQSDVDPMEESINLLRHYKLNKNQAPVTCQNAESTCQLSPGMSILQRVSDIDKGSGTQNITECNSPTKRPLAENKNTTNVPPDDYRGKERGAGRENSKSPPSPLYMCPVVRKKAERRALPAYDCEDCKKFYLATGISVSSCGRHRGRERPPTPPGYWGVRWGVHSDTEQFNRDNGVE